MTTRLALLIFAAVALAIAMDLAAGTGLSLAAARRLRTLIEALAIWR